MADIKPLKVGSEGSPEEMGSGDAIPIANGGTGATTANLGLNNLLPLQTGNDKKVLKTDGVNTSWGEGGGGASDKLFLFYNFY